MTQDEYTVPQDLRYTESHEWLDLRDKSRVRIGVTDYAQKMLHDIVYVELPKLGEVQRNQTFTTLESVKTAAEVYSPLSGRILEVNSALTDAPDLVNKDPYNRGWICLIQPSNVEELNHTLNASDYLKFISTAAEKSK
ncbi:MAG: glycine cleavage system protein GcvH [Candidatus Bathyarchaeia archaeon]